jgi:hypothetical protein
METMRVDGLTLFFDVGEREAAELIGKTCQESILLIHEQWGLDTPTDCRVYVMTSWLYFLFHAMPWPWRIAAVPALPILYLRMNRMWPYVGGWATRYGKRRSIGIKPPSLMALANTSIGEQVFIKAENMAEKVQHITCHEQTHAFAAHLRLPMWLNEGLAMLTVDKFFQKPTVIPGTIKTLLDPMRPVGPESYRRISVRDKDAMVYAYVRGYWLTRYLEETQPQLLRSLLAHRRRHKILESEVAAALGMNHSAFWSMIDDIVAEHFMGE